MRNGWYMSWNQICHFVKNGKYICNGAVRPKPRMKFKTDQLIDNLTCKRCMGIKGLL